MTDHSWVCLYARINSICGVFDNIRTGAYSVLHSDHSKSILAAHIVSIRFRRGIGTCPLCRTRYVVIWPIETGNRNPDAIEMHVPEVQLAQRPTYIQNEPWLRIIVLPDVAAVPRPAQSVQRIMTRRQSQQVAESARAQRILPLVHQPPAQAAQRILIRRRSQLGLEPSRAQEILNRRRSQPASEQRASPTNRGYEYPYVRVIDRVRHRQPQARMNYNVLRCVACGRVFQTNDLPALPTNGFICSIECYRRV